uniref:Uncharacterized protein n=1 Tax=Rhizophora mucronata TaxID=61149 RepID=A0A2P2JRT2_RHIMU
MRIYGKHHVSVCSLALIFLTKRLFPQRRRIDNEG